jgi:hypothetical protein
MKTPIQELIETFEEMRSPIDSKVDVDFAISLMKSMLEKEKEVLMDAYMEGGDWESLPQPRFDNYYNATFNTKER